jgi:hypothetical protein
VSKPNSLEEIKANNTLFLDAVCGGQEKRAASAVHNYTRTQVREESYWDRIVEPQDVKNEDLTRLVRSPKPYMVIDREPGSPAAVTLPFNATPSDFYIRAARYEVGFERIWTPTYVADVDVLRTWHMDIRQVLSDTMVKDILSEQDGKAITVVDLIVGAAGTTRTFSGIVQHESLSGGWTRQNLQEAFKILTRATNSLEVAKVLCNNTSIREMLKHGRDEVGGDMSQDFMKNGWKIVEYMGVQWLVTIKHGQVADDNLYLFAPSDYIGKNFVLEDTVMHLKKERVMIEMGAYKLMGGAIGNAASVGRAVFT